jgi:flagellar basal-body rod protein FlgB
MDCKSHASLTPVVGGKTRHDDDALPLRGKKLPPLIRPRVGARLKNFSNATSTVLSRVGTGFALSLAGTTAESASMDIQPFAQHEQALRFRALRNLVLTSNIANADTPNYKARDIEFSDVLNEARGGTLSMSKTSEMHRDAWANSLQNPTMKYRIPTQSTLDGNTVEADVEQAAFAENAVQYRASLAFLNSQIRTLRYALKGGD